MIAEINQIRAAIAQSLERQKGVVDLKPPVWEHRFETPKEEEPQGWSLSPINPAVAFAHLSHLKLQKGWKLVGYEFVSGGNGNGGSLRCSRIEQLDLSSCIPSDKEVVPGVVLATPRPRGPQNASWTQSNQTEPLRAYVQASLLYRELEEFGARWHGCSWGANTILLSDPWSQKVTPGFGFISDECEWTFVKARPASWEAKVSFKMRGSPSRSIPSQVSVRKPSTSIVMITEARP